MVLLLLLLLVVLLAMLLAISSPAKAGGISRRLINNGINYPSTGAGFLPSIVVSTKCICLDVSPLSQSQTNQAIRIPQP